MTDDQTHGAAAPPRPSSHETVVERQDGAGRGRYRVVIDGAEAELTYRRVGSRLFLDHTFVPDALRGRNVGGSLVRQAVEDARREGYFLVPLCPFAKAQLQRHPEWQDVLYRSPLPAT